MPKIGLLFILCGITVYLTNLRVAFHLYPTLLLHLINGGLSLLLAGGRGLISKTGGDMERQLMF